MKRSKDLQEMKDKILNDARARANAGHFYTVVYMWNSKPEGLQKAILDWLARESFKYEVIQSGMNETELKISW